MVESVGVSSFPPGVCISGPGSQPCLPTLLHQEQQGMADRLNLHLNVNVTETLPRCGSNQIAGRGIAHTSQACVCVYIYCTYRHRHTFKHTIHVPSQLPVFKENRALQCVCMGGGGLCEEDSRQIQVWSPEVPACFCCSL